MSESRQLSETAAGLTPQEKRADRIRRLRVALRWSQYRARHVAGGKQTPWHPDAWSYLEDPGANPTEAHVIRAAEILGVEVAMLYR
jgi:hypothetical protein